MVGATAGDQDGAFADLVERYGTPGRHYHTLDHASTVVDAVLSILGPGDDWGPVVLAAWYHDVVYDATWPPTANEGASAVVATQSLQRLRASLSATGEVARLIALTVDHRPPPGDRNGALLCDADLSTLAADRDDYDRYAAGVRAEFGDVPDDRWLTGRRRVLRSFLDRTSIFHTLEGRERWESRARINISDELARLS